MIASTADDIRDAAHAIKTFTEGLFEATDVIEVRPLSRPAQRQARQEWVSAAELSAMAAKLRELNSSGQNIYVGVNPRKQHGGGSAKHVALARCLFVDWDGIDASEAQTRITAAGLPQPTLFIASGHGVHAYWRLTEPIDDLARWTELQKKMIASLGSDKAIHDAPRIMRLPGFLNVKREPHALCRIIKANL